ncbi:LOW QUALITY PROTEIN: hypothetical protein M8C21_019918, partial [Ambrosia artemisiifolia]
TGADYSSCQVHHHDSTYKPNSNPCRHYLYNRDPMEPGLPLPSSLGLLSSSMNYMCVSVYHERRGLGGGARAEEQGSATGSSLVAVVG